MSLIRLTLLIALPGFCLACTSDKDDDDTGSSATGAGEGEGEGEGEGDGDGEGEGEGEGEGVAPFVVSGTASCLPNSSGPGAVAVSAEVDDPQGTETIAPLGSTIRIEQSGVLLGEGQPACRDGACVWSAVEDTIGGVNCTTGPELDYLLTVVDEDGNTSEPTSIAWSD